MNSWILPFICVVPPSFSPTQDKNKWIVNVRTIVLTKISQFDPGSGSGRGPVAHLELLIVLFIIVECPLSQVGSEYVSMNTTRRGSYKRRARREPQCSLMGVWALPSLQEPFTRLAPHLSYYLHCPPITKIQLTPLSFPEPVRVGPPEISPRYLSSIYWN